MITDAKMLAEVNDLIKKANSLDMKTLEARARAILARSDPNSCRHAFTIMAFCQDANMALPDVERHFSKHVLGEARSKMSQAAMFQGL